MAEGIVDEDRNAFIVAYSLEILRARMRRGLETVRCG